MHSPLTNLLFLVLGLLTLSLARPHSPTPEFGCNTVPTAQNIADISQVLSLPFPPFTSSHKRLDGFPTSTNLSSLGQLDIDTWIHVVAASEKLEDGWVTEEQILAQMVELNANYAPSNIKFTLKGTTRSINSSWANDESQAISLQMKRSLRKGDYKTMNIYLLISLDFNSFGYAQFPGQFPGQFEEGSDKFYLDGITINAATLPGGSYVGYNLGRTATHETGHWFGLFHTFGFFDCNDPNGDLIADTPVQSFPTVGCPTSSDSCPNQPGLDAIHNYMDYSSDICYTSFTPLQSKRMHDIYHTFRSPRRCLAGADSCLRSLRNSTISGRLQESMEFCGEFTKVMVSDVAVVKGYAVEGCKGGGSGSVVERVSSACSCLPGASGVAELPIMPAIR